MKALIAYTDSDGNEISNGEYQGQFNKDDAGQELNILNVYPEIRYQSICGLGGAITESAGSVLNRMGHENAKKVIGSYFDRTDGIGYSMIRTHIDSCDFSETMYEADSDPADRHLRKFSVARSQKYVIPYIKMAYEAAGKELPVLLSPWSPPAYMKTNNSRINGGHLKKECYQVWSEYMCRYIEEYKKLGVNVAAVSVQNEPNASQRWDSCLYTSEEEKEFLSEYLYPEICREGLEDIGIYIWDHNKERIFDRVAEEIDGETENKIAGVAFHWYSGDHFDALRMVHERYPDKKLIFSEGCIEYSRFGNEQLINARQYAHDIIGNFKAGMSGLIDWNIVLNSEGGPNYAGNLCEAPVMCDVRTKNIKYMLSYYYIGHFSKFLYPGAVQVGTSVYTDELDEVGFENTDGSLVIIIFNKNSKRKEVNIRLYNEILKLEIKANEMLTVKITKEE